MLGLWVTLALLLYLFETNEACSCLLVHPQSAYCENDMVILAKSTGYSENNFTRKYTIEVGEILKNVSNIPKTISALTPKNDGLCKKDLESDTLYLISGYFNETSQQVLINMCGWIRKWNAFSTFQKDAWKNFYKNHCDCNIFISFTQNSTLSPKECFISYGDTSKHKYAFCGKKNGVCKWNTLNEAKDCNNSQIVRV